MKEGERRILIAEKASVVRDALSVLLAGVESEGDVTPGTRERLEEFAKEGCGALILDLRTVEEPLDGISPGVRNIRASHIGRVSVVSCEVITPQILQQIEELCCPHSFPKQLVSSLGAFVHTLF